MQGAQQWGLAFVATSFGLLGLLEDLVGVSALRRLAVQFVGAAGACLFLLDGTTGPLVWRYLLVFGTVVWLVAFVNAYNFMDGINGISIAQAAGAGLTWMLLGVDAGSTVLAVGGAIVAGAALGFAPYNLPRARMFLGDVGSYFIGAWLAAVAVLGLRAGVAPEAVLAPLILYLADTGTTLVRRVARGERWYLPHREHVYQRLGDAGWSHVKIAAFVAGGIGVCAGLGAVSTSGSVPARLAADVTIGGVVCAYLLAPKWAVASSARMAAA
ncbi:MAG: UDP-phosphate glycosyltransferase [Actinomycetota bacterium]|nr:UDP-phosphate glycosyltransferase [Actinomycetota bacterium]